MVLKTMHTYDLSRFLGKDNTHIKVQSMNDCNIHRYDNKMMSSDKISTCELSTYGLCRSVITDNANNIIAFSPPKSLSLDDFIAKYPGTSDIVASEFIEGTMINVFWSNDCWEFATRSNIGATNTIHSRSFRDMLFDAMNECNLDLDTLPTDFSYSFVLQHPDNRIVVTIEKPQLYLIAVYSFPKDAIVKSHCPGDFPQFNATTVKRPEIYDLTTYAEFARMTKTLDYSYLGVMLTNPATGERTKMRNPNYEKVRHLNSESKLMHQYLCLRQSGTIVQHLKCYPENNVHFIRFQDQIKTFTRNLRDNYISCYIRKEKPLKEYSSEIRTHMYNLHHIYKTNLKPIGKILVFDDVITYVNQLEPLLLISTCKKYFREATATASETPNFFDVTS
jgi:hypothetical protein